ncbi:MAG: hypothetical protein ACRDN0_38630, partial [Trebonia sp.]
MYLTTLDRDFDRIVRRTFREETRTEGDKPVVRERYAGSVTRRVRLSDNLDPRAKGPPRRPDRGAQREERAR